MTALHYRNTITGSLSDFLTPQQTRLIPAELRHLPHGVSEVPLEFHLKPATAEQISFPVPWGGILYGFARPRAAFERSIRAKSRVMGLTISDWDGDFVLIFETENPVESTAVHVARRDVLALIESARRPVA